jgi:hypothetical protein
MEHLLFLNIHRQDEEIQTFISCEKFDKVRAETFRDEILRQITNVLSGEKPNLILPFGDEFNSQSTLMVPADVVRNNPIVIDVVEVEEEHLDNLDHFGAHTNVDHTLAN